MPLSVDDQLRQLGAAYDELVDELTVDEVVVRAEASASGASVARFTPRRLLLIAATFAVIIGGIVAVSVARRGPDAPELRLPGADLAPAIVPDGAVLTASVATEFGWFELHEHPDGDRRCLTLRTAADSYGGCYGRDEIAGGSVVGVQSVQGAQLVWGLVPPGSDSRADLVSDTANVDDERRIEGGIEPDANGIWFAESDSDDRFVIVDTPCCQVTVPLPSIGTGAEREIGLPTALDDVVAPRAPITIDGARTSRDGRAIELFFLGEASYEPGSPCTADYVGRVAAQDQFEVAIDIEARRPGGETSDQCTAEGVFRRIIVPLDRMLLQRDLLINGELVQVFDVSRLTFPMEVPAGWQPVALRASERAPELMWEIASGPITEDCRSGEGGVTLLMGPSETFGTFDDIANLDGTIDVNGFPATFGEITQGSRPWLAWQAFEQTLVLRADERSCPGQPVVTLDDLVFVARNTAQVQDLAELGGPIGGLGRPGDAADAPFVLPATLPSNVSIPVRLDLDGVAAEEISTAIADYLELVATAVSETVGPDVYGGHRVLYSEPVELIIVTTDGSAIEAALDRIATAERDRITIEVTEFSANDNAVRIAEAERRLADAGIDAMVFAGFDALDVWIETPDGSPDPALEASAREALGDIEVNVEFNPPPVPLRSP